VHARNNFKANIQPEDPAESSASSLKSFKKIEGSISGPNPGTDTDDFPIVSLIDEPSSSFYDSVLQNIGQSGNFIQSQPLEDNFISSPSLTPPAEEFRSSSRPSFINSFASSFSSNPNSFDANKNGLNSNPYYAPEEFTYNQDPILIDHSDSAETSLRESDQDLNDDRGEVIEDNPATVKSSSKENEGSINEIERDVEQIKPTLLPTFLEEIEQISKKTEKSSRSLFPKGVFRKRAKSRDYTNLVKTIEYKQKDIPKTTEANNSSLISEISSRLQCPELSETGFCSVDSGLYPESQVAQLMEECGTEALVRSWDALVPLDLDSLGDNSRSVISSQKDRDRPWSWTVSAYSKSQVCQSDLAFTQPSYARDTRGREVVVVQAGGVHQSVSVDTCLSPGSACPGLATCSAPHERSLCVQRFTHQYLLAIPVTGSPRPCPVITAVKFPSGCVCHAQTQQVDDIFGQKLV